MFIDIIDLAVQAEVMFYLFMTGKGGGWRFYLMFLKL